jgi:hypothetical protein
MNTSSQRLLCQQTEDSINKKMICHLIGHITNLNKIVEEIKKDANTPELTNGIKKIDEGISDIKFYIAGSLSSQTLKKEMKIQMNPINTKMTMGKIPTEDNPLSPRSKNSNQISPRITIFPYQEAKASKNSPSLKRRNTDCTIRYRK